MRAPAAPPKVEEEKDQADRHAYLARLRSLAHTIAQLERTLAPLTTTTQQKEAEEYARAQDQLAFRRELGGLKKALGQAQQQLRQLDRGGDESGELRTALREDLAAVEGRIRALAHTQRREHESLRQQERVLRQEVAEAAAAAGLRRPPAKAPSSSSSPPQASTTAAAAAAAAAVLEASLHALNEEILAAGGPTGGWPAEDHARFLALWREFRVRGRTEEEEEDEEDPVAEIKGNLALLDRAARVLYKRSEAEVMRHILWYVAYRRRVRARAALVAQWKDALRHEAEESCGGNVAAQRRRAVGKWRQQREQKEQAKAEAQKQADWQAQQQQSAAQQKRAAWTKKQLAAHRAHKEAEAQRLAAQRARQAQDAKEQASFDRLMRGQVSEAAQTHLLQLALARRARLSLQHAEAKRQAVFATRPERKAEARSHKQQAMLQSLAFEEALLLDEQCPADRVRRSLPRYKHHDTARLNSATEAWTQRRWDDEELDAKDRERLFCWAHERPLPPGLG